MYIYLLLIYNQNINKQIEFNQLADITYLDAPLPSVYYDDTTHIDPQIGCLLPLHNAPVPLWHCTMYDVCKGQLSPIGDDTLELPSVTDVNYYEL